MCWILSAERGTNCYLKGTVKKPKKDKNKNVKGYNNGLRRVKELYKLRPFDNKAHYYDICQAVNLSLVASKTEFKPLASEDVLCCVYNSRYLSLNYCEVGPIWVCFCF